MDIIERYNMIRDREAQARAEWEHVVSRLERDEAAARAEILDSLRDVRDCARDVAENDSMIDVRVYLRPDGSLDFVAGDPCYDTDHRGACAASAVGPDDDDDTLRDVAAGLFEEVVECARL